MYSLAPLSVNSRGGKCATLLNGKDRVNGILQLDIIFPPGNFERDPTAARQNITARVTPNVNQFFTDLENWAIP